MSKYATITHGLDFEMKIDKKITNVFKHTFSVLRDNGAQMALQTLNIYGKKAKYFNIGLAFCASMPHGSTKRARWESSKAIDFSIYLTIKFDTLYFNINIMSVSYTHLTLPTMAIV